MNEYDRLQKAYSTLREAAREAEDEIEEHDKKAEGEDAAAHLFAKSIREEEAERFDEAAEKLQPIVEDFTPQATKSGWEEAGAILHDYREFIHSYNRSYSSNPHSTFAQEMDEHHGKIRSAHSKGDADELEEQAVAMLIEAAAYLEFKHA